MFLRLNFYGEFEKIYDLFLIILYEKLLNI